MLYKHAGFIGPDEEAGKPPLPVIMLPFHTHKQAFGETFASRLLAYAIDNEQRFEDSEVYTGANSSGVDPEVRISMCLRDLGPLATHVRNRLTDLSPELLVQLGITPFDIAEIEVEMVAHGDGAHFRPHVDIVGRRGETQRIVTAVYYFHRRPQRFTGGALRLFALRVRGGEPLYHDVHPEHDSLVAFPSWLPHEVRSVRCASGRFEDSRFALNIWFARQQPSTDLATGH